LNESGAKSPHSVKERGSHGAFTRQSAARKIIRVIRGLAPTRFNYSIIQRFNGGEAIRVHSCVFVVNIRRWLRLTIGE
jgi:hypothetical protein